MFLTVAIQGVRLHFVAPPDPARTGRRIVGLMSSTTEKPRLRSFADDLRLRSADDLATLVRSRPDIADPVPEDLAQLAARASSNSSIRLALESMTRAELAVLTRLAVAPQPVAPETLAVPPSQEARLLAVIRRLWSVGVLWGLQPSSLSDRVYVATVARELLKTHAEAAGGDDGSGPLDLGDRTLTSSPLTLASTLDGQAGQYALAAVTTITTLAELWGSNPPKALRAGGLAVKDLLVVAEALGVDELAAGFWVELASICGLVAADGEEVVRYAPTVSYDAWCQQPPAAQWPRLARGWLSQRRDIDRLAIVTGDRASVLGQLPEREWLPELRLATLRIIASTPPGEVAEQTEIQEQLADRRPMTNRGRIASTVASTLREAELLGVTARHAISSLGRELAGPASDEAALVRVAQDALPPVTEEFVAQADLTLVVPGPPSPALRQLLGLVADVESTGGAAVYRVSQGSVARAFDSGLTPADLIAELRTRSATELPQPLEYMVNDAARRYGDVRIGSASAYLRCENEQTLNEILAHPDAGALGLVRLSATALSAEAPAIKLAELARRCGHAPLAMGANGDEITSSRRQYRAADVPAAQTPQVDGVFVHALVKALTRTDAPSESHELSSIGAPSELPRLASAASAEVLRMAHTTSTPVWVGYADNAGSTSRRLVDVVAISGGAISAFDHSTSRIRTLVLSRVTGAQLADGTPPSDTSTEYVDGSEKEL